MEINEVEWEVPIKKKKLLKTYNRAREFGWDKFLELFFDGTIEMIKSEKAYRKIRRASVFKKKNMINQYENLENKHHDRSINHIKDSIRYFKEANKKIEPKTKELIEKNLKNPDHIAQLRNLVFNDLEQSLLDSDFDEETTSEIKQCFEETFSEVENRGLEGSLDYIETKLNELILIRSDKEKNRGRGPKSPFAWWKMIFIIVAGAAILVAWILALGEPITAPGVIAKIAAAKGISESIVLWVGLLLVAGC